MEVVAEEPQEDELGGHHLSCVSSALGASGLLVEDALATRSLMTFEGGVFVKKALCGASCLLVGGLLAFVAGTLVKKALAMSRFFFFVIELLLATASCLPQLVHHPLPIPVGMLHAPNSWGRRWVQW
jgi:hypothetical protein